jgi:ferritin-like metal-binding protein YciE
MSTPQPPTLTSPRDLLLDDLKRLLTVETTLARAMLPKLIEEVENEELKSALQKHHEETKGHVANVEQAFAELGQEPSGKDAPGLVGLKQEHDEGVSQVAPALRGSFDAGSAIGSEHYEIAIYSGALLLAKAAGEDVVEQLLGENLDQEFAALKKLERIAEQLTQQAETAV